MIKLSRKTTLTFAKIKDGLPHIKRLIQIVNDYKNTNHANYIYFKNMNL